MKKFQIFVAYHRPYKLLKNEIITPIHAGRTYAEYNMQSNLNDFEWCTQNLIGDNSGDNISYKNKHFCETTVTYWIWKNVVAKYVGLMHYRRIFNFSPNVDSSLPFSYENYGYTEQNLEELMSEYDVILPYKSTLNVSLYKHYSNEHYKKDIDYALKYLETLYPEMSDIAKKSLESNSGYFCNMCFAKKQIFDNYAQWLFSILFNVEKEIKNNVFLRDNYQQRVYGFLAERLTSAYFHYIQTRTDLKIKECPVLWS